MASHTREIKTGRSVFKAVTAGMYFGEKVTLTSMFVSKLRKYLKATSQKYCKETEHYI